MNRFSYSWPPFKPLEGAGRIGIDKLLPPGCPWKCILASRFRVGGHLLVPLFILLSSSSVLYVHKRNSFRSHYSKMYLGYNLLWRFFSIAKIRLYTYCLVTESTNETSQQRHGPWLGPAFSPWSFRNNVTVLLGTCIAFPVTNISPPFFHSSILSLLNPSCH
jgi:hypothetical protein